jgi:hypothetical protein
MCAAGLPPELLMLNQLLALAAENRSTAAASHIYEAVVGCKTVQPDEKTFGAMINCAWVRPFVVMLLIMHH